MNGKVWYEHLLDRLDEFSAAGYTSIWLPPPTESVSLQGYLPLDLYNLNSKFGSEMQLKTLLSKMREKNIKSVADIVINHRCVRPTWRISASSLGGVSVSGSRERSRFCVSVASGAGLRGMLLQVRVGSEGREVEPIRRPAGMGRVARHLQQPRVVWPRRAFHGRGVLGRSQHRPHPGAPATRLFKTMRNWGQQCALSCENNRCPSSM